MLGILTERTGEAGPAAVKEGAASVFQVGMAIACLPHLKVHHSP